jgi:hypothetical protein
MSHEVTCPVCSAHYNIYNVYCKQCNSLKWFDRFNKWTSGNPDLDGLIQNSQSNAKADYQLIEWIDSSDLQDLNEIDHGVYRAVWKSGPLTNCYEDTPGEFLTIHYTPFWNATKKNWNRSPNYEVSIKAFTDFKLFLKEVM